MIMLFGLQAFPRMFFSCMDVAVDLIYLIDLLLNFRMGFLEEGILVRLSASYSSSLCKVRKKISCFYLKEEK